MGCGRAENEFHSYIMTAHFLGEESIFKGQFKFQLEFGATFRGDIAGVSNLIEICCSYLKNVIIPNSGQCLLPTKRRNNTKLRPVPFIQKKHVIIPFGRDKNCIEQKTE